MTTLLVLVGMLAGLLLVFVTNVVLRVLNKPSKNPPTRYEWFAVDVPANQFEVFRVLLEEAEDDNKEHVTIQVPIDVNSIKRPGAVDVVWQILWRLTR